MARDREDILGSTRDTEEVDVNATGNCVPRLSQPATVTVRVHAYVHNCVHEHMFIYVRDVCMPYISICTQPRASAIRQIFLVYKHCFL